MLYYVKQRILCIQKGSLSTHITVVLPETMHEYISFRLKCSVTIHTGEAKLNISLYDTIVPKQQNNNIRFSITARDLFNSYTIISVPEALVLKHLIIRKVFKRKRDVLQPNLSLNSHFHSSNTNTF